MVSQIHCFGPVAKQNIMTAGVCDRGMAVRKQREKKWAGNKINLSRLHPQ
jgi:hypothetical protein